MSAIYRVILAPANANDAGALPPEGVVAAWTTEHQAAAEREGWCLFLTDRGPMIQRDDDAALEGGGDVLWNDEEALRLVQERAELPMLSHGLHALALAIHYAAEAVRQPAPPKESEVDRTPSGLAALRVRGAAGDGLTTPNPRERRVTFLARRRLPATDDRRQGQDDRREVLPFGRRTVGQYPENDRRTGEGRLTSRRRFPAAHDRRNQRGYLRRLGTDRRDVSDRRSRDVGPEGAAEPYDFAADDLAFDAARERGR